MQRSGPTGYAISIPGNWYPLPGSHDAEPILGGYVSSFDVPEDTRVRLRFALDNVNRIAFEAEGRTNWALIRDPAAGRVDAIMSMSFPRQTGESFAEYRQAAGSVSPSPELEQVERTVAEYPLAAGPAIVVHEFVLPRTDGGVSDPAVERAIVALFPLGFESFVEFSLMTQDLAAFDNAAEYLLDVVGRIQPSTEGLPE